VKAIVVEDSRLARTGLIRMLEEHPTIHVVGDAEHPKDARALIASERPELLFLDIHMPGESGFELLESLDYSPKIIFTTAYSEYAIQSFEHNTIDYLLKPISKERLAQSIDKIGGLSAPSNEQVPEKSIVGNTAPLNMNSRILVKDSNSCHLVPLADIRYFESCKNYVQIMFGEKKAFVKKTMAHIEQRLPSNHFFRVSRQHIVNLECIDTMVESISDGYDLTMNDGKSIDISRRNASRLKELLSL